MKVIVFIGMKETFRYSGISESLMLRTKGIDPRQPIQKKISENALGYYVTGSALLTYRKILSRTKKNRRMWGQGRARKIKIWHNQRRGGGRR